MREGCFEGLDAMLDWHPDTRNTVNTQTGLANVQVRFTFHGRSAHASGAPEQGRSALDAVEAFDFMMNLLREHVPQTTRIHYVITDGGVRRTSYPTVPRCSTTCAVRSGRWSASCSTGR